MSVLRVVVVRSGGFAGVVRTAEVDDPARAERLSAAVRASAANAEDRRARDAFVYEFTLVTASSSEQVEVQGGAMDADLRAAVRALFA